MSESPQNCPHCGARLKADESFCPDCGARLQEPTVPQPRREPAVPPPASKSDITPITRILIVVLLIIGVIIIGSFIWNDFQKTTQQQGGRSADSVEIDWDEVKRPSDEISKAKALQMCYDKAKECSEGFREEELLLKENCKDTYDGWMEWSGDESDSRELMDLVETMC